MNKYVKGILIGLACLLGAKAAVLSNNSIVELGFAVFFGIMYSGLSYLTFKVESREILDRDGKILREVDLMREEMKELRNAVGASKLGVITKRM